MRRSKADLVREWLEKARRDLVTAQNGLNAAEPFADVICFHELALTPYAIETRYPKFESPMLSDAGIPVEIAQGVERFVLRHLPDEIIRGWT